MLVSVSQEVLNIIQVPVSGGAYSGTSVLTNVFKHYLFDTVMFTHLNTVNGSTFTTGEKITGGTSGATGTLESISTTTSKSKHQFQLQVRVL